MRITIKQICILTINKFDQRDYERLGARKFLEAGFSVVVLDLNILLRSEEYRKTYLPPDEITDSYVIKVQNYLELESVIVKLKEAGTFIFAHVHLYPNTIKLFRLISKYKLPYAIARTSTLPDSRPIWKRKLSSYKYYFRFHIIETKIMPANIVFIAGNESLKLLGSKINNRTKIIDVGSIDYATFCDNDSLKSQLENPPGIVFIDEYFPLHPDFEGERFMDVNSYYTMINEFLEKLEIKTNLKIGIAVHPRARYNDRNPFKFPLYYGQIRELIHFSKYVVGHASTAFSFAVLEHKPIIQVCFKKLKNHISGKNMSYFGKELKLPFCYLDEKYTIPEFVVDEKKYKEYILNYLIRNPKIKRINFNDAFIDYINWINANKGV